MQRVPAGLPLGMPGIGDEMEITVQHAPQPGLQSMKFDIYCFFVVKLSEAHIPKRKDLFSYLAFKA